MRNPTLHLVGIATSPGGGESGGGVFGGSKAEEELRHWLETRLDALGIDPVAYSRSVLSLLRRPDSVLTPPGEVVLRTGKGVRRSRARLRNKLPPQQGDREQRRAVIQCLTSAADHKCGVEPLVNELCEKLRDLEGGHSKEKQEERDEKVQNQETKPALESLTPRDRALRYYAAFPALQPSTPKKFPQRKDRNSGTMNNNNNNNNNNNSYNNRNKNIDNKNKTNSNSGNKGRHRKTKISIQHIESQQVEEKEGYGFAKSMELEREKEQEQDLDQLRLAQLKAKFDQSLEALWDSGPGNTQGTDSIWAAPSLSIPSGPLWPTDAAEASFSIPASEGNAHAIDMSYQEFSVDDSPLIPLNIDWFNIEDNADEPLSKENMQHNVTWSDSVVEGPWCWRGFSGNLTALNQSPRKSSCFFPVAPCKSTATTGKELRPKKASNLPDPEEDLLTSARTHFRPIKEDGHWADGTTFPVNNSVERVAYRRSESGHLLYLPGGESPYMEYRESHSPPPTASTNLTLKFRVRQCDKYVQTEPLRSPVKRRILSEKDRRNRCNGEVGSEEIAIHKFEPSLDKERCCDDDYDGDKSDENDEGDEFAINGLGCEQSGLLLHNERKRRHSNSFRCRPLAALCSLSL